MLLVDQSSEIIQVTERATEHIELVARTCYQSFDRIVPGSDKTLVNNLIKRDHTAMLEFGHMCVRLVTDRGIMSELTRHRMASFAVESTRYVKYDDTVQFIKPVWAGDPDKQDIYVRWLVACERCEQAYQDMIKLGASPQEARQVLNNSVKVELILDANFREWRHIFTLRTAPGAHPQVRQLMQDLLTKTRQTIPVVFDDI